MTEEENKQIAETDVSEDKKKVIKGETSEDKQVEQSNSSISNSESSEPKGEAKSNDDEQPKQQTSSGVDEYAEKPEEVLDEKDLKELKEIEKENGDKEKVVDGRKKHRRGPPTREEIVEAWEPKTKLGQDVKDGRIKEISEILEGDMKILESEIVDSLINVKSDLISIGQAKGKFGGGKRRAWRQTQRKTKEGNVPSFSTMAVVGDENGHVGVGAGKAKETLPARDKAIRKAKLNIMKVKRACAGFDCDCSELHSIPFKVTGKSGSVKVTLIPAPQGTGLVVGNELKKVLKMAGIEDVYSRTDGKKRTTFNLIKACINALEKTNVEDGRK
ncbi:30S ribosomal protein S5 [Candidatus Pacearchaeota archaeon]|nr:30S ribosomal protein S5 [Candidatus Pacearchaeota archaeon]